MTISVIIPCYNGARFISETLESVVLQAIPGLDLILVDDGSTDDSIRVAGEFFRAHPEIPSRVIQQANAGANAARNTGLAAAAGDWVLFLDSDDRLRPGALKTLLAASEGADAVYGDYIRIDQDGTPIGERKFPWYPEMGFLNILDKAPITSSVVLKREKISRKWENPFDCSDEFIFFSGLALDGLRFKHCGSFVLDYRVYFSETRKTSRAKDQAVSLSETYLTHFERLKKESRLGKPEQVYFNAVFVYFFNLFSERKEWQRALKFYSRVSVKTWLLLPFYRSIFPVTGFKTFTKRTVFLALNWLRKGIK